MENTVLTMTPKSDVPAVGKGANAALDGQREQISNILFERQREISARWEEITRDGDAFWEKTKEEGGALLEKIGTGVGEFLDNHQRGVQALQQRIADWTRDGKQFADDVRAGAGRFGS